MAAGDVRGKIDAPILSVIARELYGLLRGDAQVRELWSVNAPRACYFDFGTLTDAAPQTILQAKSGTAEVFYQLAMVFDAVSGPANYRIDGPAPNPTLGGGISIPAGGGILIITGMDNIRNFSMIGQAGSVLPFTRYLFK